VEIHENSSWSCEHGVERWRSNCGCNLGRGWHQQWRAPLRQAFDRLKNQLDLVFTTRGKAYFPDPWKARDAYIQVILDRSPESVRGFLKQFGNPNLDDSMIRNALWLLEMQRNGMLMYTSCGWFFDEISGLETTQCLRYAARAIQLAGHFHFDFEEEMVQALEKAPSNLPEFQNGRGVWEHLVRPAGIDLDRVFAHHAISMIYGERQEQARVYCYELETRDQDVQSLGNSHLAVGRLRIRSRLTWNEAETNFLVIHYGGLDFHAVLRKASAPEEYESFKQKLFQLYLNGSMADVGAFAAEEFKGVIYRLLDLFVEEQRRIIGIVLEDRFADYRQSFERLAEQDEEVIYILGRLHYPIPKSMRAAATVCFDSRFLKEIHHLQSGESLARIKHLIERGKVWGFQQDRDVLVQTLAAELTAVLKQLNPNSDLPVLTSHVGRLLDAASLLGIALDLWETQNQFLDAFAEMQAAGNLSPSLQQAFVYLADRLNLGQNLLGWRP
jgi:hypothetical protein